MHQHENYKFEVLNKKAARDVSPKDVECSFSFVEKPTKPQGKSWTDEALEQWDEKMKAALGTEKKLDPKSTHQIAICFDAGGEYRSVLIPKTLSTYALHTALKKNLSDLISRDREETICLRLTGLAKPVALELVRALTMLAVLGTWQTPVYGKKKESLAKVKKKFKTIEFLTDLDRRAADEQVKQGVCLAQANNLVRTLSSLPSNELDPDSYLEIIKKRAKERGYSVDFLGFKKLQSMKAGSFTAVIQGSLDQRGGLAHLTFKKGKGKKKLALIGKGLCFDTGGHNIKTGDYMHGMHRDMTGSATALALFEALIELKAPYELHAFLALAENMVSPLAYRPNDVVIASDGTSIEVVNTDAEGRMVLADTLAIARKEKPHLAIDFATLTGSAVRAIGTHRCAVFSNRDKLLQASVKSGDTSGERVWGFPIGDEFAEGLKSEHADTMQCSTKAPGDHIFAATFLSRFIGDEVPWVHCDLSADTNRGGLGLVSTEATGFGILWGMELIKSSL